MTGQFNPEFYAPLTAADLKHVDAIDDEVAAAQAQLGRLRETFLAQENRIANQIGKLREEREVLLGTLSRTYLKDRDGPWMYDDSARGYVMQNPNPGQNTGVSNGTSHDHEQPVQQ